MLQRGATRVVALDVGHGQLDWRLRQDPRVVVLEHVNARNLTLDMLPGKGGSRHHRRVLYLLVAHPAGHPPLLQPGADIVALIKPQFEAGREEVRKGIIRDTPSRAGGRRGLCRAAEVGLTRVASTPSPITGQKGNVEFLAHFRAS
jgi:23S rRNA (cytidine1920-2'-O)/16S rRNA (cytidine1409-2'-O)-methyltransferase